MAIKYGNWRFVCNKCGKEVPRGGLISGMGDGPCPNGGEHDWAKTEYKNEETDTVKCISCGKDMKPGKGAESDICSSCLIH